MLLLTLAIWAALMFVALAVISWWSCCRLPSADRDPVSRATSPQSSCGPQPRSRNQTAVFDVRQVTKVYPTPAGPVQALAGATALIGRGITAVVGPSGGGKSTLVALLGGLMSPTAGEVLALGERIPYEDDDALRRYRAAGVAVVFQDLNLIGHLTALGNAALPLLCRGVSRRRALAVARGNLRLLGLEALAGRHPHQLSRGQKQRVAIARAFSSGAAVIVADEPTGSLDPDTAEVVMDAFRALAERQNRPVVLVTHDHDLARRYGDRILECRGGALADSTVLETINREELP
jgi:putative ABC transport system ATP-binding protein